MQRRGMIALGLLALALGASALGVASGASAEPSPPSRWVTVSVATLWVRPGLARSVDSPELASPADPGLWVKRMTITQKRWLVGKLETQVLYGEKVLLLGTSGKWSRIAVPSQSTPRSSRGYPGWVPSAQLGAKAPVSAAQVAIVKQPTATLWQTPSWRAPVAVLSYGTTLPAVSSTSTSVEVVTLEGRHRYLRCGAVNLHASGSPWPKPTAAMVVAEARRFLGLPYLWAGTSGFGFDCSGFTYAVFRQLGLLLPRDAGAQFAKGAKVASLSALRLGDLIFFHNTSGQIHHVGMYIGDGKMIHSPGTGLEVMISSLSQSAYASEFAGGRRYVP
jgi:cell wall-associated NlpC family hydrolase